MILFFKNEDFVNVIETPSKSTLELKHAKRWKVTVDKIGRMNFFTEYILNSDKN